MTEPQQRSSELLTRLWKRRFPSNSIAAYLFALVCVAVAVGINFLFDWPGVRIAPFATLFPAVLIAAIAGGIGPGLIALIAGGIAAWFLLLPSGTILVSFGSQVASMVLYGATGLLLVGLVSFLRQAAMQFEAIGDKVHDDHDRLVAALGASGAGTWRWDIQNDVVEWDDALCRLYGIAREDAPRNAAGFISIIHPSDREYAGEVIRKCVEGIADAEYQFRAVVPKGTLWIYDRSKLVRDAAGRPAYMMGACLDVTDRHRSQEERGRIAAWLRMAMEVAQIGTWEIDPETQALTASVGMDRIFGMPRDGKPRTAEDYLKLLHPDDIPAVRDAMARRSEEGEPVSVEYRVMNADGSVRWLASRGAYVRSADGSGRMVGALFDITDRKRIEQEREAALQQRDLLLKEINHRVKNNLQMVSSLLNLQANRMSDPVTREHFRKAIDRVQAVGDIHARLYQGDQLGHIDFDHYLNDLCVRLRQSMLDTKSVELKLEVEPYVLDLDRAIPLGLIVNELVTNAIKHAFPADERGWVLVKLKGGEDGHLVLSISDNGRGLPEEDAPGREGLGMRLVQGLMRQVGGTLDLEEGPGANYVIRIPETKPSPAGNPAIH